MNSDNWNMVPMSSVCLGIYDGPHATPKKTDTGPVFLGISNLERGRLNLDDTKHLSEDDYVTWTRRIVPRSNDIVFSYETRLGEAAIIPEGLRCCLGRRMGLLRPDITKVEPKYLLYAYLGREFQEEIKKRTVQGSTVNRILLTELPDYPIRLPPLAVQKNIAGVLGAFDDKIELNRQMNETLESIVRAIFKSWFVDFDPVWARMDGRDYPLDAETLALFPDHFEDSQLGEIPAGWRVSELGDLCKVRRGSSPRPIHQYIGGPVPWVKIADATKAEGPFMFETKEGIIEEGVSKSVFLKSGTLILSNSATTGLPIFLEIDGCIHDGWLYFQELTHITEEYLYLVLLRLTRYLTSIADGTVQKNLNTKLVASQLILVPDTSIVSRFQSTILPIFRAIREKSLESRTLSELRDTLLPKLISGELRLPEVLEMAEDVL